MGSLIYLFYRPEKTTYKKNLFMLLSIHSGIQFSIVAFLWISELKQKRPTEDGKENLFVQLKLNFHVESAGESLEMAAETRFSPFFSPCAVFARPYSSASSTKASNLNIETGTSSCWSRAKKLSRPFDEKQTSLGRFFVEISVFVPALRSIRSIDQQDSNRATIKQF